MRHSRSNYKASSHQSFSPSPRLLSPSLASSMRTIEHALPAFCPMASGTTSVLITHYYVVIATAISDEAHLQYPRHEAQQLTGLYLTFV